MGPLLVKAASGQDVAADFVALLFVPQVAIDSRCPSS
jgi:hypothetical protein